MPAKNAASTIFNSKKALLRLAISAALISASPSLFGQDTDGSVRGSVIGSSANTTVQVVSTDRGTVRTESVDDDGRFRISGLTPGSYEVRVLQNGNVVDTQEVSVSLGSSRAITMGVSSAQINEIVTSGRRQSRVDTAIAESGLVISTEEILGLPIARDLTSVALLAPGANAGDNRF
ncbi:MAG: carboxypeptidase regulatory-like domain-containing protein, partial [OM182 bacterium]